MFGAYSMWHEHHWRATSTNRGHRQRSDHGIGSDRSGNSSARADRSGNSSPGSDRSGNRAI